MAKTNKKRALAMMVAVIMILCLVPIVSMAATVTVGEPVYSAATDKITVSGTTGAFSSGGQVTMLAIRANEALDTIPTNLDTEAGENSIMYIDQIDPDSTNGTFSWEFSPRGTGTGNYVTIFVGGTEVSSIGFDSVLLPTAVTDGPDVTCAETCLVGENIVISFDATNYAAWANIISIKVNGVVLGSEDFTLDKVAGRITIPTDEAISHNIVISAEGYEDVVVTVDVTLRDAGTASLAEHYADLDYFVAGSTNNDAVVDLSDSVPEGWLTAVNISVVDIDGEGVVTEVGSVDKSTGLITITKTGGAPDTVTTYTLQFRAENYEDLDVDFDIVSKVGALIINLREAVTVDWAEKTGSDLTDEENYYITVPASDTDDLTGLSFVCEVYDGESQVEATAGEYIIGRSAVGEGEKTAYVKAIIDGDTVNPVIISEITVAEIGASGSSIITEDDVTLLKANAYGKTGYTLVKIVTTNVTTASETLMIGDYEMFYSPVKNAFYGIIQTSDIDDDLDTLTVADIANAATKATRAAKSFYFGNVSDPLLNPDVQAWDMGVAGNIVLEVMDPAPTDDQLLAADVSASEPDGIITAWDAATIGNFVLEAITALPVNE